MEAAKLKTGTGRVGSSLCKVNPRNVLLSEMLLKRDIKYLERKQCWSLLPMVEELRHGSYEWKKIRIFNLARSELAT